MNEVAKVVGMDKQRSIAYTTVPYALINEEMGSQGKELIEELTEICGYYDIYKRGERFTVEGTQGDYVPAQLRYKTTAALIDKEARFLFAEAPDIIVDNKGSVGKVSEEAEKAITILNDLVKTVLDRNNFEEMLLKAAKDSFIGKRVAGLVNFNEEDGITVSFLPSTQFLYETKTGNPNIITKFVCFIITRESTSLADKRIFKKKYTLEGDIVYLEESVYNGSGVLLEEVTRRQKTKLTKIPAAIFINDGLTGERQGSSEVELLKDYESWYSKLANADKDAERKSMNPIRYAIDMEPSSTKGLSSSAGSFWDLQTDQNLPNANSKVGALESSMEYREALKLTLDRVKNTAYEQIDMPNINLDALHKQITSGKALKAIYWPLIVRCKEKMKVWGPQLRNLVDIIIQGSLAYPNCIVDYVSDSVVPVEYEIHVVQNTPLPEDEMEEKGMDLMEVSNKVMSKKSYMKKWKDMTDDEVEDELEQIALERQLIEDSFMPPTDFRTF